MKKTLAVLSLVMIIIYSCSKENEEDLSDTCETDNITYSGEVSNIISSNCTTCHNQQSASGGVMLHDYENVKVYVEDGSLLGSIRHEVGYSNMPQGQEKLPECNIAVIEAWVNDGYPNN